MRIWDSMVLNSAFRSSSKSYLFKSLTLISQPTNLTTIAVHFCENPLFHGIQVHWEKHLISHGSRQFKSFLKTKVYFFICFNAANYANIIKRQRKRNSVIDTREEGEEAMEVTAREGPREAGEGVSVLVQMPCLTCQTPTFSRAGARRCLPELS